MAKGERITVNKSSKCPLCALPISSQLTEAIFFRSISDDAILTGIDNRLGIFLTSQDLKEHREKHLGFEIEEPESKEKLDEVKEIDSRIRQIKKRLKVLDNRGEIYSNGYAALAKSLVDLIKLRNEIREGTKVKLEGKISVQEWFSKKFDGIKKEEKK